MFKSKWFPLIVGCITLIFFVLPLIHGYAKSSYNSSKIIINDIVVRKNTYDNGFANIKLDSTMAGNIKFSHNVKDTNDIIYIGEDKVAVSTLGNYVVEVFINSGIKGPNLDKSIKSLVRSDTLSKDKTIGNVLVTYPPDDDVIAVYIGCNYKPKVDINLGLLSLNVKINKND